MVKAVYSVLIFVQLFQKKCFLPAQQSVLLGAPALFSKFKKVLDHLFLAAGIRKITAYLKCAVVSAVHNTPPPFLNFILYVCFLNSKYLVSILCYALHA